MPSCCVLFVSFCGRDSGALAPDLARPPVHAVCSSLLSMIPLVSVGRFLYSLLLPCAKRSWACFVPEFTRAVAISSLSTLRLGTVMT